MRIFRGLVVVLFGLGGLAYGQAASAAGSALTEARVYPVADMPVRKMANGGESRDVLRGALASGEAVAVHESMLPVGAPAPALHVIQHSEIITVVEGTLEFMHGDKVERIGPGGVIYVAMGTSHAVKNVGDVPAKYVVVQIGGDVKK
jgi:XRE family transcriptional regulator, regulator of sulfur utilization